MRVINRSLPRCVQILLVLVFGGLALNRSWNAIFVPLSAPVREVGLEESELKSQADHLAANWVAARGAGNGLPLKTVFAAGYGGYYTIVYEDSAEHRYQMSLRVQPGGGFFRWSMSPYRKTYS